MKRTLYIVLALGFLAASVLGQKSDNVIVFDTPWVALHGFIGNDTLYVYPNVKMRNQDCGMIIHGLTVIPDAKGSYTPWYVDAVPAWGARQELRAVPFRSLLAAKKKVEEVCR